jgi:hypothetical protein
MNTTAPSAASAAARNPTQSKLTAALSHSQISSRCKAIEDYINDNRCETKEEFKEVHAFFPHLLASIFAFDSKQ